MDSFRSIVSAALCMFMTVCSAGAQDKTRLDYPATNRVKHVEVLHGQEFEDPFAWMEQLDEPQLHEWMRRQDLLFEEFVSTVDNRAELEDRIQELRSFDTYTSPVSRPIGYFFGRRAGAGTGGVQLRLEPRDGSAVRTLIDSDTDLPDGMQLAGWSVSPDGSRLVYLMSEGQSNWREAHVLNTISGEVEAEGLTGLNRAGGVPRWLADGSGFYYVHYNIPSDEVARRATPVGPRVRVHHPGTPQSSDIVVFEESERPESTIAPTTTDDGRFELISLREGASQNADIYIRRTESDGAFEPLLSGPYLFLGNSEDELYFYTTEGASNGRIVAVDAGNPVSVKEIVPEMPEAVSGNSLVGGNAVGYYGGRFVVMYVEDALPLVRVFDRHGDLQYTVNLPDVGTIWGGFQGRSDESDVYYNFLSLSHANEVYRLDLESGRSSVFRRANLAFDPDRFETKQVFYTSKDGARVPMFIVHRRGITLDGSHPLFMYAYGAYAWTAFLWYQPHIIAWLEMGGVYALPGIRGGGEYGREWHAAGTGRNRPNAIDDYVSAAEWLISSGYTSSERMVANGGSASGSLAAAAVVRRPDLFAAAVIDIPSFDMLHTGSWTTEFGDPEDPEDFGVLRSWSPYHNLDEDICYPPMLIMAGERDETALPWHAYKFTALLQENESCRRPKLLNVMWETGHTHGTTPEETSKNWADAWAFLIRVLEL